MKKFTIVIIVLIYSFLGANLPFADTWTQKADFGGTARYGAVGFSIGAKGYIGTGEDGSLRKDFWEYDPAGNSWTQKADFGGTARSHAVGFSIDSKGYIGTGADDGASCLKDFWEYDPTGNSWTQMADFGGTARNDAVGFSIDNMGYIGTGYDGAYIKDFWVYDPAGDSWTKKADVGGVGAWGRSRAVGFSIGTKGYIGTGFYGVGLENLGDFFEYNPTADTWTIMTYESSVTRRSATGFAIGSKGYIGVGLGDGYVKDFWEYDPAGSSWTQKADFGTDYTGAIRFDAVGFSIGTKGYIGTGLSTSSLKTFWEYDPCETTPGVFTFTDQTAVGLSQTITSNIIIVSGITCASPISITGGTYKINSGSYVSADGTVSNDDTVTVQLTSSGSYATATSAMLNIGGVSDTFSVTTLAAPAPAPVAPAGGGGGGCFIATVAFGSPLAGQVEILRQFRDRYLLTNALGRNFVAWYYRNGPAAANYIEGSPLAKTTARVALYPLIGFSLLLISGYLPLMIIGILLAALLVFRAKSKKLEI